MKCPECGWEIEVKYGKVVSFCPKCGSALSEQPKTVESKSFIYKRKLQKQLVTWILIGMILSVIGLTMNWGTKNDSFASLSWITKGSITKYKDEYGQTLYTHDGTYLSPEVRSNSYSFPVSGADMLGGRLSFWILLFMIFSVFYRINRKFPVWIKYIPFGSYILFFLVWIQGLFHGPSMGLIFYTAGLVIIYMYSKKLDIWIPEKLRKKIKMQN